MNKTYVCECGEIFNEPQKFNGHKAHCKAHHIAKYGNLDVLEAHDKKCTAHNDITNKISHDKAVERKQTALDIWLLTNPVCEKCGKPMTEKFGSGRFCSRACANSRSQSRVTKQKFLMG